MSDVTRILSAIERGDPQVSEQLLPLVYEELRRLAAQRMVHETPGQTIQSTGLVHEAYLRLVDRDQAQRWSRISTATAYRHWACARAWLRTEILGGAPLDLLSFRLTRQPQSQRHRRCSQRSYTGLP